MAATPNIARRIDLDVVPHPSAATAPAPAATAPVTVAAPSWRRMRVRSARVLLAALAASLVPAGLLLWAAAGVDLDEGADRNAPPVAVGDALTTRAGFSSILAVAANDRDRDGDVLMLAAVDPTSRMGGPLSVRPELMANGDGAAGDETNFSGFEFVPGAGPDGEGAFRTDAGGAALFSDELIPVDIGHTYTLGAWSRNDGDRGAEHSLGLASYDADGRLIEAVHVNYQAGSETELAADLAPGDTEIRLVDASRWLQGDEFGGNRNIVMYPYVSDSGVRYRPYTYSRHTAVAGRVGLWGPGAIEDDVVRLHEPWDRPNPDRADGVWPAGTKVANAKIGTSHSFSLVLQAPYTPSWTRHEATIAGVGSGGRAAPSQFRPGTSFVRFVVLPNRFSAGSTAWYAGISLVDESGPRYEPPPGFVGVDSFGYTIADEEGETASATATVAVVRNFPPDPAPDQLAAPEDTAVALEVAGNDQDRNGDRLEVVEVRTVTDAGGRVALDGNLVPNGGAAFGDASYFSAFSYVPGAGPDGQGAFTTEAEGAVVLADGLVAVDVGRAYRFTAWSRAEPDTGARQWIGFASYDVDGELILPEHVRYAAGTRTELAADLAPGDVEIRLADGSDWLDGPEAGANHNIVMYPYVSPSGVAYEPYTYSRHTEPVRGEGLWGEGAIEGDVIRLNAPWARPNPGRADGLWPAGTLVANSRFGEVHNWVLGTDVSYSGEWARHDGFVAGVGGGPALFPAEFRPGTAFIGFAVLANRGAAGSVAWYAGIEVIEQGGDPLVYTPPPGFTGTDRFEYTVGDGFGGEAIGTVAVTVGE